MKYLSAALALTLSTSLAIPALAQTQTVSPPSMSVLSTQTATNGFSQFRPRPAKSTRLDFTIWDELLKETVFYTGPSLRQRASRPSANLGSRVAFGHTSPYRLEGNKVMFEGMSDDYKNILDDYAQDLVDIGNRIDIAALPRNEQLAYWLNLHNVLAIQAIAQDYPMSIPSKIEGEDGLPFHDSKRVTIAGIPLSLRNIREDIVYSNWNDPLVIYGFFHGDLGSPSMQRKAFTGTTLSDTLKFSGGEFANSLRGFRTSGNHPRVSQHYEDAAPYFFPNYETDLRTHLATLLNPEVLEELSEATGTIKTANYEWHVADMTKGTNDRILLGNVETVSDLGNVPQSSTLKQAMREHVEKLSRIRQRGLFGTVTIEDIQTPDPDAVFGDPGGPSSIELGPLPGTTQTDDE